MVEQLVPSKHEIVMAIFKIDLVSVLSGFLHNFLTIPIMNPLSWFMIRAMKMICQLIQILVMPKKALRHY